MIDYLRIVKLIPLYLRNLIVTKKNAGHKPAFSFLITFSISLALQHFYINNYYNACNYQAENNCSGKFDS